MLVRAQASRGLLLFVFFRREREFNETRFVGNDKNNGGTAPRRARRNWANVHHVTSSNVLKERRNLVKKGNVS